LKRLPGLNDNGKLIIAICCMSLSFTPTFSQTWVDSVDAHGRNVYMPAGKYKWDWGQATFLHSLVQLYNAKKGADKQRHLDYIRTAMDSTYAVANGKHPNAVASGHGMAFLARITGDKKYLDKANEIYLDYLKIPCAANGGVSHRAETVELWDDTVYMFSMFLLEMYRLTKDEKYIADFLQQFNVHNEVLTEKNSGLWVHAWDADNIDYDDGCSVKGWPDPVTRKSSQVWARGNAWIGMSLADALEVVGRKSSFWKPLEKAFKNYIEKIVPWQNTATGYWYQLVTLPGDPKNFQESSCTAMFSYAIVKGLKMNILDKKKYLSMVDLSYKGLQKQGLEPDSTGPYLVPANVSGGTCVGDKEYYLTRKIVEGTGFDYGSFIMFGLTYEQYKGIRK
jgi:unsaturated rhamnogalacturonyl hydrolase